MTTFQMNFGIKKNFGSTEKELILEFPLRGDQVV